MIRLMLNAGKIKRRRATMANAQSYNNYSDITDIIEPVL